VYSYCIKQKYPAVGTQKEKKRTVVFFNSCLHSSHSILSLLRQALVLRCFNRGDRLTFHELRYIDHVTTSLC
jgi:hypothetical protein